MMVFDFDHFLGRRILMPSCQRVHLGIQPLNGATDEARNSP